MPVTVLDRALVSRLVEKERWLLELIEKKNHRAEQQDEELHRHLHDGVKDQADAARAERTARQIPLHLRLIGAEIGERKEKAAQNSRPDGVTRVRIERKVYRLKLSHLTGDRKRIGKGEIGRQTIHGN